ncbi:type II toxin-antitoxin system Phd/YefM family antitoxin [Ancylobacter polymorphus]|uniref:Type II toxin-antitoxin system Phd/YefM family antitoxin n=1 Tax=Ancylobacter polymorphus TaxID=223390 RepID=A0A9E7CX78_9HYPH|nr:type II toxin-antitoxin system Phd/YefM family antitoxin [Ancylobacter polymorphus]UOK73523.1 type II toxin-antitoxin system Phd/YefM family antitoxin [Ancylobacter polymorphus]
MDTTLTLQVLDDNLARALKAAAQGAVFIVDENGKPAYVLLSYPAWQALAAPPRSISDRIRQKDGDGESVEFDPEPARIRLKPAELD